jgi:hypothetical protein
VRRKQRFKQFVKTHERWFTFAGALIVFLTFVVKEGFLDSWKETGAVIDTAQSVYSLNLHMSTLVQRSNTVISAASSQGFNQSDVTSKDDSDTSVSAHDSIDRTKAEVDSILVLAERIDNKNDIKDLEKLEQESSKAQIEMDKINSLPASDRAPIKGGGGGELWTTPVTPADEWTYQSTQGNPDGIIFGRTAHLDMYGKRLIEFIRSLDNLGYDAEVVSKRTLKDADVTKKRNEFLTTWAWRISAFLFTIGWSLGILGKLYGVPEAAGGGN